MTLTGFIISIGILIELILILQIINNELERKKPIIKPFDIMPKVKVNGKVKHFPYTKAGKKAAAKARKKK